MRYLADDEHEQLCSLSSNQRFYIQRWMELFDRYAPFYFRMEPVTIPLLKKEEKRESRPFDTTLIKSEYAKAETKLKQDPLAGLADDTISAEALASKAGLLGFNHEFAYQQYRYLLGVVPDSEDIDFPSRVESLSEWLDDHKTPRKMTVWMPCLSARNPPKHHRYRLELKPFEDEVPPDVRYEIVDSAWDSERTSKSAAEWMLRAKDVYAVDPNRAYIYGLERYLFYRHSTKRPCELQYYGGVASVEDPKRDVPKIYAFTPPVPDFQNRVEAPVKGMHWQAIDCCDYSRDGIRIDRMVKHLTLAYSHMTGSVVDPEAAFRSLIPLCDAAYSDCGSRGSGFERTVQLSANLLAVDGFRSHLEYIASYLKRPTNLYSRSGNLKSFLNPAVTPEGLYNLLSDDDTWKSTFSRCEWDSLLDWHRSLWVEERLDPAAKLCLYRDKAKFMLARAMRARHYQQHYAEPLQDYRLVEVLYTALRLNLRLRVWAKCNGKAFPDVIKELRSLMQSADSRAALPCSHESLTLRGWSGAEGWAREKKETKAGRGKRR